MVKRSKFTLNVSLKTKVDMKSDDKNILIQTFHVNMKTTHKKVQFWAL